MSSNHYTLFEGVHGWVFEEPCCPVCGNDFILVDSFGDAGQTRHCPNCDITEDYVTAEMQEEV